MVCARFRFTATVRRLSREVLWNALLTLRRGLGARMCRKRTIPEVPRRAPRLINYASPRRGVIGGEPIDVQTGPYSVSLGASDGRVRDQIKLRARVIKRLH